MKEQLCLKAMFCTLALGSYIVSNAQEAKIGENEFNTLSEAFAAAAPSQTITVLKDITVGEMIPVTKTVTLDLNGKTITNNVKENRLFRLSGVTFTIDGNNGNITTPAENTASYGFVDFRDANGTAYPDAKLVASDCNVDGHSDDGAFISFRTNGQSIEMNNVNVDVSNAVNWSIINGYNMKVDIKLNGGTYTYTSTVKTAGVFQAGAESTVAFNGVTVNTDKGPILEVHGDATFTDCTMTNTDTNSYFATCIASAYGGNATVKGGSYTANYPLYVYNSGGTINVDGGEFNGAVAAIKADNENNAKYPSTVNISGGTFNGPMQADSRSSIEATEGTTLVETVTNDGRTAFVAAPSDADIAAFIATTPYTTLDLAFAEAREGDRIILFKDIDAKNMIPVTKTVTLDLNGKTITNNVKENRLFRLSGVTFTIDGNDGNITTPADNTASYGFVDFRDANGTAYPDAKLVASDCNVDGYSDGGAFISFKTNGQSIEMNNVNVDVTNADNWSIINGYNMKVDIKLNGGTYTYTSTVPKAGVFQAGAESTVAFNGVTVNTDRGPILEVHGDATFTDCTMTNTDTNSYFATCIASAYGGNATVKGGTYTANYPLYVYNSGGTINVDGGEFNGAVAAIKADNAPDADSPSVVNISGGTFNGLLQADTKSSIKISGGTYTDSAAEKYCVDGFGLNKNSDGTYSVVPTTTGIEGVVTEKPSAEGPVYNLQGIKVGDSLTGLPAGIYIVNGEKVKI